MLPPGKVRGLLPRRSRQWTDTDLVHGAATQKIAGLGMASFLIVAVGCFDATKGAPNGDRVVAGFRGAPATSTTMGGLVEHGACSSRHGVVVRANTLRELWLRITPAPAPRQMSRLVAEMVEAHTEQGGVGEITVAALWASRAEASRGLPRAMSGGDGRGQADEAQTEGGAGGAGTEEGEGTHDDLFRRDRGFEGCVEGLLRLHGGLSRRQ